MFKFLRPSKPQPPTLQSLVAHYRARGQVEGHLARAKSLDQLGRSAEAAALRSEALAIARKNSKDNPTSKEAQVLLAIFLIESGDAAAAERHLAAMLDQEGTLLLTAQECVAIRGQLLALQRNQPAAHRPAGAPRDFTQVYCCVECGRLHNYLSLPCPECDWYPLNRKEVANGLILSNAHIDVPALLQIGRRISAGESPGKIVGNLDAMAEKWLADPGRSRIVDQVFEMAQRDAEANKRNLAALRQCSNCKERITFSAMDSCEHCGRPVAWPQRLRVLICLDSVLYWLEQRIEPSTQPEFSEFVCVLVLMLDRLLRKQEVASETTRHHALDLLQRLGSLSDIGQGAVISTANLDSLQIYLVQDRMREDSKPFAQIIAAELQQFIRHMNHGTTLHDRGGG